VTIAGERYIQRGRANTIYVTKKTHNKCLFGLTIAPQSANFITKGDNYFIQTCGRKQCVF